MKQEQDAIKIGTESKRVLETKKQEFRNKS